MTSLLTAFPAEILLAIIRQLDPWRLCRRSLQYDTFDEADWESYAALASLSRTCKTLQHLAQPQLFRRIPLDDGNIAELTRTLIKQPHLAGAVQDLSTGNLWLKRRNDFKWDICEEDTTMLDKYLAVYYRDTPTIPLEQIQLVLEHYPLWDSFDISGALAVVAIAQTTNIQRLIINPSHCYFPKSFTLPELPCLTEFYYIHSHCTHSYEQPKLQDNSILNIIFAAAPALKRFHAHIIDCLPPNIPYNNVTEAVLTESCLSYASFRTLIERFPRLQKFTYECAKESWAEGPEPRPREIADLLPLRRDTVTHLSLDFRQSNRYVNDQEYVKIVEHMHALESLVLGLQLFTDYEATTAALLKCLPKSIQSVEMLCIFIGPEFEMIARTLQAQFPNLKIRFENDEDGESLSFP
ncbi:hypothetical protein MGYG_02993 [Nannizzia gypsea CBS 118893]|uniref:F-box domain-containing protein n=1 Tax=Arthroderma gypseum (strain ATCC MYA-4604 / CBS 118893) TaxID=535722 RepID=E4UQ66_ARTGP|nr:hypothetical protein MGYG_02993 [Nannizzia gypsea CBS 118893]EFQ99985.1 hypothetical protein MGYG_02993 [Nannizzia gypsea CBS 118893]